MFFYEYNMFITASAAKLRSCAISVQLMKFQYVVFIAESISIRGSIRQASRSNSVRLSATFILHLLSCVQSFRPSERYRTCPFLRAATKNKKKTQKDDVTGEQNISPAGVLDKPLECEGFRSYLLQRETIEHPV
nr:hypothetical protein [Tranosema rostrale ichnovirus]